MAEEKYAKAKRFILSPEGYQEISYLELCRRRDMEPDYQNRKFIPLHGMLMEVTPEQYALACTLRADRLQGYYLARPMPGEELCALMRSGARRTRRT